MRDQGLLAELDSEADLRRVVGALQAEGLRSIEVFTPYPVPTVIEQLHPRPKSITRIAGVCAVCGVAAAYFLQWYLNGFLYPLDVGGRPPHSVLAFIPVTFEMGVLASAVGAMVAGLALGGLFRLWRPIFDVEGFERASIDRFFVLVRSDDPRFDWTSTRASLTALAPIRIVEIERSA